MFTGTNISFRAKKKLPPLTEPPTPLDAKRWKSFLIGDLFNIKIGKAVIGNTVDKVSGKYAYITRKESNNGLDGFIDYDEKFLNVDFPVITVGAETAAPFVQNFPFFTGTNVNILSSKVSVSEYSLMFIVQAIKMQSIKYSYGYAMNSTRLEKQPILLPATDDGTPDFDYMENYIRNIEAAQLQKYRDFIKEIDFAQVPPPNEKIWRSFRLLDYFDFIKGDQNDMSTLNEGDLPLVSAKNSNNGYKAFVANNGKKIFNGNCLTLNNDGDGGAGIAYYQPTKFLLDTHVTALLPKIEMSRETLMFISRCITIQREKFGHGYSLNNKRLNVFRVMLPVTDDGTPDFEYMENYIRNIAAAQYRKYLDYIDGE